MRQGHGTSLTLVLALTFALAAWGDARAQNPNIVVIMADDLEVGLVESMLAQDLLPNIKTHIIDKGSTFSNSFVTNSLCCPSRATFLTGLYSHNHGVLTNVWPFGGAPTLDDRSTVPRWLRAGGYITAHVGKYLNDYGNRDMNGDGGWTLDDARYIPPGWNWWVVMALSPQRMYNYVMNENGQLVLYGEEESDHQTDVIAREAEFFIQGVDAYRDASPFFLYVGTSAPHVEVFPGDEANDFSDAWSVTLRPPPRFIGTVQAVLPQPPSFNEEDVSDKPSWLRLRPRLTPEDVVALTAQYRDRMEAMRGVDDLVGTIVQNLEATGEIDNTVIIFTSDNGFASGEHRLPQKLSSYEESIRVPLYVRAPGTPEGQMIERYVLNNDLAPTIAEIAGVAPWHTVDGTSFVPLLTDPTLPWRKRFLVEHWRSGFSNPFEIPTYFAVRTTPEAPTAPNQTYIKIPFGALEVYDLNIDPYQLTSIHNVFTPERNNQRFVMGIWRMGLQGCKNGSCRAWEFN